MESSVTLGRAAREALAVCAVALVALLLSLGAFHQPDLYWHLAVGRHVAEHHALPTQNLWSYTTPEHPFAATSWLYGLCLHLVEQRWGLRGVHLVTALLVTAAFSLCYATARRWGASLPWAMAASMLAAFAAQFRFSPRPHTVSYLLLAATAWLLSHARLSRRRWPLALVPPLIAVWSNFHAGAVFGVGLTGCYLAAEAWEAWRSPTPLRERWGRVLRLAGLGVVVALSFLANPSGVEVLRYATFHLGEVDQVVELGEFVPPHLRRHAPFWALLAACLALNTWGALKRRGDLFVLLATLAFAVLAMRAVRLVPKFLLVALPPATALAWSALQSLLERSRAQARLHERVRRLVVPGAQLVPPLAVAGLVLALAPEPLGYFLERLQLGPNPYYFPERMARFTEQAGISGRCFASWDVSGFVEWRLPGSPVFIDPRLRAYPAWLFQELSRSDEDQATFDGLMDRYGTEWAFRGHSRLRLSGIGRFQRERWAVVYWDEAGQVLLRRDVPRFERLIQERELHLFTPGSDVVKSFQQLRGTERKRWVRELERVAREAPAVLNAQVGLCLERARERRLEEAAAHCDAALEALADRSRFEPLSQSTNQSRVALALVNLGDSARETGQVQGAHHAYTQALELYSQVLRRHPGERGMRQALAQVLERLGRGEEAQALTVE